MKKALCCIVIILGASAIALASAESVTGTVLLYTIPQAVCGAGLIGFGFHGTYHVRSSKKYMTRRAENNRQEMRDQMFVEAHRKRYHA